MKEVINIPDRIELLINQNKYEKALSLIENELTNIKSDSEKNLYIILKNKTFLKMGEYTNTLEFINLFLTELKDRNEEEQYLNALLIKIECLWQLGYYDQAFHFIKEGEILSSIIKEKSSKDITRHDFELNNHKGIIFWYKGELSKALIYLKKSLDAAIKLEDINQRTRALNNLGLVYQDKGNLEKSLENFLQVLKIQKSFGNNQSIALTLNNIGINYRRKGEYYLAINKFNESCKIFESLGHNKYLGMVYNNLGYVYSLKGKKNDLEQALEYHCKSLIIREQLGNKSAVAVSFVNLGIVYQKLGEIKIAKDYFMKSLAINEQFKNQREIAECLYYLALLALNENQVEIGKEYLKRLIAISEKEPTSEIIKQTQDIEKRIKGF